MVIITSADPCKLLSVDCSSSAVIYTRVKMILYLKSSSLSIKAVVALATERLVPPSLPGSTMTSL